MSNKKLVEYDGPLGKFSYDPEEYEISEDSFVNIKRIHGDSIEDIIPGYFHCLAYKGNNNKPTQPIGCTNYSFMFADRADLLNLDLSDWDVSKVADMKFMFAECINLESVLGIEEWDLISINTEGMFENCNSIKDKNLLNKWKDITLNTHLYTTIDSYNEYLFDLPNIYKQISSDFRNFHTPVYINDKVELEISIGNVYRVSYLIKTELDILDIIRYPQGFTHQPKNSSVNVKVLFVDKTNDLILVKPLNNLSDFGDVDIFYVNKSDIEELYSYNTETINIVDKSKLFEEIINILKKVDEAALVRIDTTTLDNHNLIYVTNIDIDENEYLSFNYLKDSKYITVKEFLSILENSFNAGHKGLLEDDDLYIRYTKTSFDMYLV